MFYQFDSNQCMVYMTLQGGSDPLRRGNARVAQTQGSPFCTGHRLARLGDTVAGFAERPAALRAAARAIALRLGAE
jgi:hypothetical protein